jgi:hypothetical protein
MSCTLNIIIPLEFERGQQTQDLLRAQDLLRVQDLLRAQVQGQEPAQTPQSAGTRCHEFY